MSNIFILGQQCLTIANQLCLFPFTINGKTYYECTTDAAEFLWRPHLDIWNKRMGASWCPTYLYPGRTVYGGEYWNTCSTDCPNYAEQGRKKD